MLTWRLWEALRYPDENNPLFARIYAQQNVIPGSRLIRRLEPVFSALTVFTSAALVVVAPLALLVLANGLGALVAFNVANTINREREGGTYDLLGMTPAGLGAANWQIASACATRLNVIYRLASVRTIALTTLFLLLIYALSGVTLTPIPVIVALVLLNVDAIQTQITGCLSGMLAQAVGNRSANGTTFASVAIFTFIQLLLVYLPVTMLAIALAGALHDAPFERWLTDGIVAVAVLLALVALREAIIRVIWRELERRLL